MRCEISSIAHVENINIDISVSGVCCGDCYLVDFIILNQSSRAIHLQTGYIDFFDHSGEPSQCIGPMCICLSDIYLDRNTKFVKRQVEVCSNCDCRCVDLIQMNVAYEVLP